MKHLWITGLILSFLLGLGACKKPQQQPTAQKKEVGESATVSAPLTATVATENRYCGKGDIWIGGKTDGPAGLPQTCIYTGVDGTPSPGVIRLVPVGASVSTVLAQAQCGDIVQLQAGATYPAFTLPALPCDAGHWITIRTSASDASLPPPGKRINPSWAGVLSLPDRPAYSGGNSNVMAKILAKGGTAAITAADGAQFYRIGPGLEITRPVGTGYVPSLIMLTGADHIILDRDWIHGSPQVEETAMGVGVGGSTYVALVASYLNDFKCLANIGKCTDAKAWAGGDTLLTHAEHTWKVWNNFLEASTENILHGGGLQGNETPTDLEYRYNHFYKPPSWRTCTSNVDCYVVKNLFELKNGSRVLLEDNLMEYSWGGYSQAGFGVLLTPRGAWARVTDVTIRFNYIRHTGGLMQLIATRMCHNSVLVSGTCPTYWEDSGGAGRWSIHDLLFDDVDPVTYKGGASSQLASQFESNLPLHHVKQDHLTVITPQGGKGVILSMGTSQTNPQKKMGQTIFTNSIVFAGKYGGIWQIGGLTTCVTDQKPLITFPACFTNSTVTKNLIVGWTNSAWGLWPAGNETPATATAVFPNGFALSGGNYHVAPAYQKAATDGGPIGVRLDTLMGRIAGVQ